MNKNQKSLLQFGAVVLIVLGAGVAVHSTSSDAGPVYGPDEGPGWYVDDGYVWSEAEVVLSVNFTGNAPPRYSTSADLEIFVEPMGYPLVDSFSPLGNREVRRCEGRSRVFLDANDPRLTKLEDGRTVWVAFELHEFSRHPGLKDFSKCEVQKIRISQNGEHTELDILNHNQSAP